MSVDCQCVILDWTVFLYDVCSFLLFWSVICLSVSWWAGLIGLAINWIWFCVFLWFSSWCCQPVCIKSLCTLHQWMWCAYRSTGQTIWLLAWTLVTLPRMWQKPRTICRCIMNARWDQATQMECYCATGTWTDSVQSPQVSVLTFFSPLPFQFYGPDIIFSVLKVMSCLCYGCNVI